MSDLKCAMCLADPQRRLGPSSIAVTILEGQAICFAHLDRAMNELNSRDTAFNRMWKVVYAYFTD